MHFWNKYIKKYFLKICPYIVSLVIGFIFYFLGKNISIISLNNLFINFSAIFFSITLIYLFYDIIKTSVNKKLNKEITDYIKLRTDKIILGIINNLFKILYGYEKEFKKSSIKEFLSLEKKNIREKIEDKSFVGFKIFKDFKCYEEELSILLSDNLITNKINNEQIISLIRILKNVYTYSNIIERNIFYLKKENQQIDIYKIIKGNKINTRNYKYANRYLLLENYKDGKRIVRDFGDFNENDKNKLLQNFKIKNAFIEIFISVIHDIITSIEKWLSLTDYEFVVDVREFRIIKNKYE